MFVVYRQVKKTGKLYFVRVTDETDSRDGWVWTELLQEATQFDSEVAADDWVFESGGNLAKN